MEDRSNWTLRRMPGSYHVEEAIKKRDGVIFDEVAEATEEEELEEKKEQVEAPFIDEITKTLLREVKRRVTTKDEDWVCVIDGREGSGKSLLAMQICKELDPTFSLERVTFNSDQFTYQLKKAPKYSAVLMDEAFAGANSRASMSEVNRALISVATEMRQRNLFVIMCIPAIFDLDKYFALWRCKTLFHVYQLPNGQRGKYIIFPFTHKKLLYLAGKKTYSYAYPPSPFPPLNFRHQYIVNEIEYRKRKAEAFRRRAISPTTARYRLQRDIFARWVWAKLKEQYPKQATETFNEILVAGGAKALAEPTIRLLVRGKQMEDLSEELEEESNETNT